MSVKNRMQNILNLLLEVPSIDPDDARRRRLLNILLIVTGAIIILISLSVLIFRTAGMTTSEETSFILVASATAFLGLSFIYLINRYKSGSLASYLFLFLLMIVTALSDEPLQLVNGRSTYLFTLPIIIAGVLLGSRAAFIFYALVSLEMLTITAYAKSDLGTPLMTILSFLWLTTVIWLLARSLEQALRDLRMINANLDKLVVERTHALAESLTREHIEAGRSQAILNSIADGVVVFNADNISILVNPALRQLTENPTRNLTGITLNEFVQGGGLSPQGQRTIIDLIEHPEKIEAIVRVEWGKRTLSTSIARVQDTSNGEHIGTVAVFRDVTREAELEKMKTTFVAIVSHELRTPLNAILGHAEILKESIFGAINEKQSTVVERIMVNTHRLLALVGDLLDEAQMRAGKLSTQKQALKMTTLLENLHATMDEIAREKGLYLTDEIDPQMPQVINGDSKRLQQILVNLVGNSVKFTETGGIHIRILRNDENHWVIEVSDTGMGISEKEIPNIFDTFRLSESFTTRQHGGIGLGLSIVKQLVELMNGEITVKSELDKGSTFTVTLPI